MRPLRFPKWRLMVFALLLFSSTSLAQVSRSRIPTAEPRWSMGGSLTSTIPPAYQKRPDDFVGLRLVVAPEPKRPVVGEPVALYVTLTNQGSGPAMIRRELTESSELFSPILGRAGDGRQISFLPTVLGNVGVKPAVPLNPGESLRFKRWLVSGYQRPALPSPERRAMLSQDDGFAFTVPGHYEISGAKAYYEPRKKEVADVEAPPVIVEVREPNERERGAFALLCQPFILDPPVGKKEGTSVPQTVAYSWQLALPNPKVFEPVRTGVREERGRVPPEVQRLHAVSERYPDTVYAWYAAFSLARWEATEFGRPNSQYQKPARPTRALELLTEIERRPLPQALREEVEFLHVQLLYMTGRRAEAERRLKKLEALELAEPLRLQAAHLHVVWKNMEATEPPAPLN